MVLGVIRSTGLGLLLLSGALDHSSGAESGPIVVTTDTPEYCHRLLDRISEALQSTGGPPPVEVASLSTEGKRMCNDGLTRGGILRLRRALLLLEQGSASP
jgi:hypothetical protein